MTDFVDRLLGRGAPPPIRPALPSLFEPATPVRPATPVEPDTPVKPGAGQPPPLMGTSGDSTQDRHWTMQPRTAGKAVALTGPAARAPVAVSAARRASARPAMAATPVDVPARASDGFSASSGIEAVREVAQTAAGAVTTPVTNRAIEPETGITTASSPLLAPSLEPHSVAHLLSSGLARPTGVPQGHPVSPGAPRYPVVDPVTPLTPAITRHELISEPDVQISIGRIEIKAVTEPAVAHRAQQRKQPVLSLEDYLRSRAGGDRR